ncbi:MAG: VOC family protein [Acidobacteriota bacterium]|nr:VOC family protein [Acidobacteriota bacterium]
MSVQAIPDGYQSVIPYLVVEDLPKLIAFLETAFGGEVTEKMEMPDGSIMHAEVLIGDSVVMAGSAREGNPANDSMLYMYVEDCDAVYKRALEAGATSVMEPATQFYGDRSGGVKGPCGNQWWVATHVEDVPPEEMAKRAMEARG